MYIIGKDVNFSDEMVNKVSSYAKYYMDNEIIIRELREMDLDEALKLWCVSFNAGFSKGFDTKDILIRYLKRNPGLSSGAYIKEGKLVGALMCGHDGRRGSIYHTAVYNEFRKKGIGKMMEMRSLEELRKEGITTGFLFINVKNPGSREFWNSIGWEVAENVRYLYKEF